MIFCIITIIIYVLTCFIYYYSVPFTNYEARASASTSIGRGNASTIYFSTPEDGM